MKNRTIDSYSEFELIDTISKKITLSHSKNIIVGSGDDSAVYNTNKNAVTVTSIDSFVENIHWEKDKQNYCDIGWKTVNAAVSDLAAMGATGRYITIACNLKKSMLYDDFLLLIKGFIKATNVLNIDIIGGNLSRTKETTITINAIGEINKKSGKGNIMKRSSATIGDKIALSGKIGGAAAGRYLLSNKNIKIKNKNLIKLFHKPNARVDIAEKMLNCGVKCAIDISDGLMQDLSHICNDSQVDAIIEKTDIPLYKKSIEILGLQKAYELGLNGGEDYELLFTANQQTLVELKKNKIAFYVIGDIIDRKKHKRSSTISLTDGEKIYKISQGKGWDHFQNEQ
ncbi:MAG: thiamine-phosphate kinase [Chloroflexi bacterium]|nr:thiamine-phosphate kinase [Chloroflexota bacterium]|tara:strand:+ start:3166 stop:4188 length:1023 start_codon:yes stop_codon:yes gene_type:complete